MKHLQLGRALDHAVSCALLSGVTACGGESVEQNIAELAPPFSFSAPEPLQTEPGPSDSVLQSASGSLVMRPCLPAGESRFAHMSLAVEYDFVALRVSDGIVDFDAPGSGRDLDSRGTACINARDPGSCRSELAAAWPSSQSGWEECGQAGCSSYGVVTIRGDEVRMHESLPALGALLGEIESPQEALLWADANGYTLRCQAESIFGLPPMQLSEHLGGYRLDTHEMVESCPVKYQNVVVDISGDGRLNEVVRVDHPGLANGSVCVGRRPPGWEALLGGSGSSACAAGGDRAANHEVGEFFAQVAALEAAAVLAFQLIEAELEAFGAPLELRREARTAWADELRHHELCAQLARRHGAEPSSPNRSGVVLEGALTRPLRALFDFAVDNVVEGCVRETFGAAVARYQAACAVDPLVRASMASIAADETRHAELSWRIQAWLESRLTPEELCELAVKQRAAQNELRCELQVAPSSDVQSLAGMPGAARALSMLDALEAQLWNRDAAA